MKTVSIIKYTFAVVGIGMLLGAFFLYKNTQAFLQSAVTTNGTVTEVVRSRSNNSTTYRPVVKFKTESGQLIEFTSSTGSSPASYARGEVVEVLYEADAPSKAKINGFFALWALPTILGSMGAVFSLITLSILFMGKKNAQKIEYLKRNGTSIKAKFQRVEVNGSVKVNRKSPYQISAQWINPNTSELHIFHSENIWFDPTDHIKNEEIMVLIDRNNPKKYYVDISFLPKVAG